jgi:transposase
VEVLHDRCAALDVSKRDVKVCLRTPGKRRNQRTTVVRTFATTTNDLLAVRDWLVAEKVTLFVPPPAIRQLRDLTRYRSVLADEQTREAQRLEKELEDAGIKLSCFATDILGVSAGP